MESSYEIISPLSKLELSPGKSQSQPNLRAFNNTNNETDRNNNTNTLPKQPSKSNQPSKNEFDYKKAVQKRENEADSNVKLIPSSNRTKVKNEFALDVFSMQGLEHNKDLLIHFYIDKVRKFILELMKILVSFEFNKKKKIQELQEENESFKEQLSECVDKIKSYSTETSDKLKVLLEKLKEPSKNVEIVELIDDLKKVSAYFK